MSGAMMRNGATAAPAELDGSWEREGRGPAAAALVGLFGIGVVYFYGQTILFFIFIGIQSLVGPAHADIGGISSSVSEFLARSIVPIRLALLVSQYLCMLLPTLWLVKRWHARRRWQYLRFRRSALPAIAYAVIGTAALFPISSEIGSFFQKLFPVPRVFEEISEQIFLAHSPVEFLWLVLLVAVTPAVCEETLFRGYAQRTLERAIGWKSVLVVGILFGLYHMQPIGLVSLSLIGLFLGYLFYRTRSIYSSMAGHFTNNFLAIFIIFVRPRIGGVDIASAPNLPAGWLALSAAVFLFCLYGVMKTERPASEELVPFTAGGGGETNDFGSVGRNDGIME